MTKSNSEIIRIHIITFDSTHKAIRTEKLLKEQVGGTLIPTPREISASCGLSFKIIPDTLQSVYRILKNYSPGFEGLELYEVEKSGKDKRALFMEWSELEKMEVE